MSVRIAAGGAAAGAIDRVVPRLVDERVASGLAAQDPDLWGDSAVRSAARGLGWTEAVVESRPLVAEVAALRDRCRAAGLDRVLLCATGGASVAAQVIAATSGGPLTVLESGDPAAVRRVVQQGLAATVVVVVAIGAEPVETAANRHALERAFHDAGIDPAGRFVVVADRGGVLAAEAEAAGHRVFATAPDTGEAFSALSAAALVPAGLAGADLGELLDEAESELLDLAIDAPTNNGLVLAAAIAGTAPRRDKLVVVADGTHIVGFGDWIEQLVAGATGKDGSGLLPVVVEVGAPELADRGEDLQVVRLVTEATDDRHDHLLAQGELLLSGSLGELLLVWHVAAAVAARLIGVDPFDRPEQDGLTATAAAMLSESPPAEAPRFTEPGVSVWTRGPELDRSTDLRSATQALLDAVPEDGYLAVTAYIDAAAHPRLRELRDLLAARAGRPTAFGWSPRVLHGAAQYRLGGPAAGVFLLVTARDDDRVVPGTGTDLVRAQSRAEAAALVARGRPVLHVEVDGDDGVAALLETAAR